MLKYSITQNSYRIFSLFSVSIFKIVMIKLNIIYFIMLALGCEKIELMLAFRIGVELGLALEVRVGLDW